MYCRHARDYDAPDVGKEEYLDVRCAGASKFITENFAKLRHAKNPIRLLAGPDPRRFTAPVEDEYHRLDERDEQ